MNETFCIEIKGGNMINLYKKNEEKIINILFKSTGTIYILGSVLYIIGFYHPSTLIIFMNLLLVGLFFTFAKYTPKQNIKGDKLCK